MMFDDLLFFEIIKDQDGIQHSFDSQHHRVKFFIQTRLIILIDDLACIDTFGNFLESSIDPRKSFLQEDRDIKNQDHS